MTTTSILRTIIILISLAAQGCTYQAWYAGLQEQQRQQCYKDTVSPNDTRQCLERVNNTTYDQYKIQREEALERAKK